MNWSKQVKENGVIYLTAPKKEFERDYTAVRQKENRLLTDELVKTLPFVQYGPHVNEWKKRLDTLERLSPFIRQLDHKTILEVGCGNGWFSKMLVKKNNTVIGLDVGKQELEQAARCFPNENLHFVCCTDLNLLPDFAFDCIVFNASIQYFDTSESWWDMIFKKVKKGGEIHLIDSPFYDKKEVLAAKERSKIYFKQLNEDQAHTYYFHHTWNELPATREILYLPRKWKRLFHKHASPFPWIRINI
jgi:ubiquinone/menaquinone biosynthesis C-methylase UbiE